MLIVLKKFFRNVSFKEIEVLGLESIVLDLSLRKKPLEKNEQYAIYIFEYYNNIPLVWNSDFYDKRIFYKHYFVAIIHYLENSDVVTAVKTKSVVKKSLV